MVAEVAEEDTAFTDPASGLCLDDGVLLLPADDRDIIFGIRASFSSALFNQRVLQRRRV